MNQNSSTPNDPSDIKLHLTKDGSLGLLALGDVGLKAWRQVRDQK